MLRSFWLPHVFLSLPCGRRGSGLEGGLGGGGGQEKRDGLGSEGADSCTGIRTRATRKGTTSCLGRDRIKSETRESWRAKEGEGEREKEREIETQTRDMKRPDREPTIVSVCVGVFSL